MFDTVCLGRGLARRHWAASRVNETALAKSTAETAFSRIAKKANRERRVREVSARRRYWSVQSAYTMRSANGKLS